MVRLSLPNIRIPKLNAKAACGQQLHSEVPKIVPAFLCDIKHAKVHFPISRVSSFTKCSITYNTVKITSLSSNSSDIFEEEDEVCPVECVKEFRDDEELFKILDKAKENGALVVVDFYKTACGSCKYIEQGFSKLCKGSGSNDAPVIFLKHNVSISSPFFSRNLMAQSPAWPRK